MRSLPLLLAVATALNYVNALAVRQDTTTSEETDIAVAAVAEAVEDSSVVAVTGLEESQVETARIAALPENELVAAAPGAPIPQGDTDARWDAAYKKAKILVRFSISQFGLMQSTETILRRSRNGVLKRRPPSRMAPLAPAAATPQPSHLVHRARSLLSVSRYGAVTDFDRESGNRRCAHAMMSICQDGPLAMRPDTLTTVFPSGINAAATFNRDLIRERGVALGAEFKGKGVNVALGPSANMLRVPTGGRNFEVSSHLALSL